MRLTFPLAALALLPMPLAAQMGKVETNSLRLIFYDINQTYLAPQLMRSFESALRFHKDLFHYRPSGKTSVLLEDFRDFASGGADVLPTNQMTVGIAPASYTYETAPTHERMSWVLNHELTHIVEMDGERGIDRFFRNLFGAGALEGKVTPKPEDPVSMAFGYLTVPRRYAPRWYHEGLAVFMETWMSGGAGRALGGYDEMVFRAMVRDDSRIYDAVGLEIEGAAIDFQGTTNSYLYGTRFITWLASRHGPEKVIEWARSGEGSKANVSAQFRHVFGEPLRQAWAQWIREEHEWQNRNLAAIRQYPVTPLRRISKLTLGSVSNSFYDETTKRLYAAVRYPGPLAHLAAIDPENGHSTRLHDVEGPALLSVSSLAFDPDSRSLFFTTSNNDQRDLNVYDLANGKATELIKRFRGGDLTFHRKSRSLWGVRHVNGRSVVIEMRPPYRQFIERLSLPYGVDVFDLDASPDGQILCAVASDSSGRQKLVRFDLDGLRNGDGAMETLHHFEFSSAASFRFSSDGAMLYGTSYFTGASNIFRFNLATRAMDVLTNTETGLFWPQMLADGRLMAFEYTAKGFVPVQVEASKPLNDINAVQYLGQQVVDKYPVVREWKIPAQSDVDLSALAIRAGEYKPLGELRPVSIYPIVQGYKNSAAWGGRVDFAEGLGLASMNITASWSPDSSLETKERIHLGVDLRNDTWDIRAGYNKADFYDLLGPTKRSLKGLAAEVTHKTRLRRGTLRTLDLEWNAAGYAGLDRLPDYQNVAAPVSRFVTGGVSLSYSHLRRSLGAVDDEQGVRWKLVTQANGVSGGVYPRFYGTLDYGRLTPLRNSSLWIRSSAGKSIGEREQPFANFYFGGFGNNYVDYLDISRYREYYSFPGVKLNQIGSTDFARTQVEWNLPPLRFRNFGTTWLYCNWVRLSVFSGVLGGNLSSPDRVTYANAGSQLDFRIVLSSYLYATFSTGYAIAQDRYGRRSSEVMVSLKLF